MLKLYVLKDDYYNFLVQFDKRVPKSILEKMNRPFLGGVMERNNIAYIIPLSTVKKKYEHMNNRIDFQKMIHKGRLMGVLNINNMIPVLLNAIREIAIDQIQDEKYKNLLINEKEWCNAHKKIIWNKASTLYNLRKNNRLGDILKSICCDYQKLEEACLEYTYKNLDIEVIQNNIRIQMDEQINIDDFINVKNGNVKKCYIDMTNENQMSITVIAADEFDQEKFINIDIDNIQYPALQLNL